jgi:TolB protein
METPHTSPNPDVPSAPAVAGARVGVRAIHWLVAALLLLLLLAGCGPGAVVPTPAPAIAPIVPGTATPARAAPAAPPPTAVAEGAALPGRLLFVKNGDLWVWEGENGVALTSSGDAFQPAWSPDGARIAYIRRTESYSDLVVMPAAGGEPAQLTGDGSNAPPHSYERILDSVWAFYPAWSPDGAEIAFTSQAAPPAGSPAAEYRLTLYAVPSSGGEKQQIYADDGAHVGRPVYTPDGTAIVFANQPTGTGVPQLYRYTRASSSAAPLAGAPDQSYDPAFSSDGRWLAFAARDGGRTDVFAMPAGGGAPVRLTSLGGARAPAFSPDGKLLAFLAITPGSNSFDLWIADLQTGADGALHALQPRQLTHDMRLDADSGLSWVR